MTSPTKFSAAVPLIAPFDTKKRIEDFQSYLDPTDPWYQPEGQHRNIKAVIQLYKDGKIDGHGQVYVMNGQVVSQEQAHNSSRWAWHEV